MLKRNNYLSALDLGSTKISACVAEVRQGRLGEVFFETMPAKGIKEGFIVDAIGLVGAITKLIKRLRSKSSINIKSLLVNISGNQITFRHSYATIPLAERGNKVIGIEDLKKVNRQAWILGSSLEEEIIEAMPLSYSIDAKNNLTNPIGLYSHRLELDLFLVCAKLAHIQSLQSLINQSGYEIKRMSFSGLATASAVCNQEFKDGFNIFCDIGGDTTELLVFKAGMVKQIEILRFGGDSLTVAISDALKVPFDLAEDIKRGHGIIGDTTKISEEKEILVKKDSFYKPIKQRDVLGVITNSANALCLRIKEALDKKVPSYEVDNFIVTGRTILLEGFIETLENTLGVSVKLGRLSNPLLLPIKENVELTDQKYLNYLTSLGMVCQALQESRSQYPVVGELPRNFLSRAVNKFKEVYQEYF
jgi:cell division protein FtsA